MYAPSKPGDQPSVEVSKEFMMSPNKLHLGESGLWELINAMGNFSECSLDKELYYHGETISVNVHIQVRKLQSLFIPTKICMRCKGQTSHLSIAQKYAQCII